MGSLSSANAYLAGFGLALRDVVRACPMVLRPLEHRTLPWTPARAGSANLWTRAMGASARAVRWAGPRPGPLAVVDRHSPMPIGCRVSLCSSLALCPMARASVRVTPITSAPGCDMGSDRARARMLRRRRYRAPALGPMARATRPALAVWSVAIALLRAMAIFALVFVVRDNGIGHRPTCTTLATMAILRRRRAMVCHGIG